MFKRIWTLLSFMIVAGLIAHCGNNSNDIMSSKPDRPPLSKVAVSHDGLHRLMVVSVYNTRVPVVGAQIEFSRSIAGQAPSYQWSGITNDEGVAEIEIPDVTGYYQARALLEGEEIEQWSSIPINALTDIPGSDTERVTRLNFPIGRRAYAPVPSQREALIAIYNAWGGAEWTNNTNWLSDRPISTWYGISAVDGWVTRINLQRNNLSGGIPIELSALSKLSFLFLIRNQLTGEIPAELGRLTNLERIHLRENQLTGGIPKELGDLSNLIRLEISYNQLTGEIPAELGKLSSLKLLLLHRNELSGEIPAQLGNLKNLTVFGLNNNQLSGAIPEELGNMSSLERLIVHSNPSLTGPLPHSLTQLTKLAFLIFTNTNLCAPTDADFQSWLMAIPTVRGDNCS